MQSIQLPRSLVGYFFLKCKSQKWFIFLKHFIPPVGISVRLYSFFPPLWHHEDALKQQRLAVGRTRIPWQLESNKKLTGRVPCPRKTKIARRQTGLQCISQAVLNTQDKDDNELLQVRPEMSWKPRRETLLCAAHLQLLQLHDLIKISPPPNINRVLAFELSC